MKIKQKVSVLVQIAILFIVGVILIGILSLAALYSFSTRYVLERLETSGFSTAEDLKGFIFDFPAHDWLLRYWYEHYDEMDIDYDAVYTGSSKTEEKYAHLVESNPGFRPERRSRWPRGYKRRRPVRLKGIRKPHSARTRNFMTISIP